MAQRPKQPARPRKSSATAPMRATPAPSEKGYTQLSFALPKYYIDVLDKEAAYLSQRRSQLLEMLVLRKLEAHVTPFLRASGYIVRYREHSPATPALPN